MVIPVYRNGKLIRIYKDPYKAFYHIARAELVHPENKYVAVNHSWIRKCKKKGWNRKRKKKNRPRYGNISGGRRSNTTRPNNNGPERKSQVIEQIEYTIYRCCCGHIKFVPVKPVKDVKCPKCKVLICRGAASA